MNRQILIWSAVVSFIGFLTGCSSHLSRSRARAELTTEFQQDPNPGDTRLFIEIGTVSKECYDLPVDYDSRDDYKALAQTGYITLKAEGDHIWNVALTDSGQRAKRSEPYNHIQKTNCDSWIVVFPLSVFSTVDVTGILEDGPHAKVNAEVRWKLTALGRDLKAYFDPRLIESKSFTPSWRASTYEKSVKGILGETIMNMPRGANSYMTYLTAEYDRYDDGWKKRN